MTVMSRNLDPDDCLACRITSGGGLIGAGMYVFAQSKRFQSFSRYIMGGIGTGIGIIGAIRLFNLPLFKAKSSKFEQFKIDKNAKVREDDSGYVIELFPSKSR